MYLEKVALPTYTKKEEVFNCSTHAAGIILGILSLILFTVKASGINKIIGSVVFSVSTVILYLSSTLYHAFTNQKLKKIFRLIDHSVIYTLISGTIISVCFILIYDSNPVLAVVTTALCLALSVTGITLTFIDQEKYKKVQMVLYMVIGWSAVFLVYPLYMYCENFKTVILLILAGGIIYTVGTVFYAFGKNKRYFHSIFHIFVLGGTVCHSLAIYFAL